MMKKATAKREARWIAPVLVLAAAVCGCFFAFRTPEQPPVTVGIAAQPGLTVEENPIQVGTDTDTVTFRLSFGEGISFLASDGKNDRFDPATGILTVPATAGRTVKLTLSRPVSLTVEESDRGILTVTDGVGEDGFAHTGKEVTVGSAPAPHYTLTAVEVNGERIPAKADGSLSFLPQTEKITLKPIFEGEVLTLQLGSSRLGEIADLGGSTVYRYGDTLRLQASYDAEQVRFLGWSSGSELENGGSLLGEEPILEYALMESCAIYANFVARSTFLLQIDPGEGAFGAGKAPADSEHSPGEYLSLPVDDLGLTREGYMAVGYTDGEKSYSFGGMLVMPRKDVRLQVVWKPLTPAEWLRYEEGTGGITILGWSEAGKAASPAELVLPGRLHGKKVTAIAASAFADCDFLREVELPVGLTSIGDGAFRNCHALRQVCLPETLTALSGSAFKGCGEFSDLRIHASLDRVYDVDYDSALADKYLRLQETANDPKRMILVGGSGMSFGIESDLLKEAFPGYTVVNFSTSVYYGVRPLFGYLEHNVKPGDVVVFGLEYRSYMYGLENDGMTNWQYLESNYDMLRDLDVRENRVLLDTYLEYLQGKRSYLRRGVKKYNSLVYSRASFDRDGDLQIYRKGIGYEGAVSSSLPKLSILTEEGLSWLRQAMERLQQKGATCYLSYPAVGMPNGHTKDSVKSGTRAFKQKLESALAGVCTPISDPADYYLPSSLNYDSMYHFSSEGALRRTRILVEDLRRVLPAAEN